MLFSHACYTLHGCKAVMGNRLSAPHVYCIGCGVRYVQPECDIKLGVAHGVLPVKLQQVLQTIASEGKQVGAVMVVSPTYFGACSDITG